MLNPLLQISKNITIFAHSIRQVPIMLSKQVTKIVQNLEKKKFREKYNLFKAEGEKLTEELLHSSFKIRTLIAFPEWIERHQKALADIEVWEATEREMHGISNFQSLPPVVALAEIPAYPCPRQAISNSLSLALNCIQDPGNLGTILRVADWFGIRHIFCDDNCANAYNPKCVQASMGAIFRVQVHYLDLLRLLPEVKASNLPVFGTFLEGENIYTAELSSRGVIVMGNEGKGISTEIEALTDRKLTIPNFTCGQPSSESLNVGVAAGIVLSEFKRKTSLKIQ